LIAIFALGWLCCRGHRRSSVFAAVALAPFAVMGYLFVPAYWQPDHAFTFIRGVGFEDVLFCFACGGVCWLAAVACSDVCCRSVPPFSRFISRLFAWMAIAILGVVAAWWAGCGIMTAVIAGFVFSGLVVLCRVPRAARLILPGAIGFTVVYACVSWLVIAIYPSASGFWVTDGTRILGLPVDELLWSLSFGATWPVVFAYCMGEGMAWGTRQGD
jgi:hypothetical protein